MTSWRRRRADAACVTAKAGILGKAGSLASDGILKPGGSGSRWSSSHLGCAAVGLGAGVVDRGGDQILDHLLFGRAEQALVDLDRDDPALGVARILTSPPPDTPSTSILSSPSCAFISSAWAFWAIFMISFEIGHSRAPLFVQV